MNKNVSLHVFLSPCTHSSRLLKEAQSLIAAGLVDRVLVFALGSPDLPETEEPLPSVAIERFKLRTRGMPKNLCFQAAKYIEWACRAIWRTRRHPIGVVHVHSLPALPVGALIARIKRVPLVYDAHELETERQGDRGVRQRLSRWVERRMIKSASEVLVVSDSIADWYQDAYHVRRPIVIRNIPAMETPAGGQVRSFRERFGLADREVLFIYQGSLGPGRGIERLLRVFSAGIPGKHVVFMGYGTLAPVIQAAAAQCQHVHFHPAVPPSEIVGHTAGADVGLCLIENTSLSYFYSLPNKLFEYFRAGLPAIINDFPEQRRVVDTYGCGWITADSDAALAGIIEQIHGETLLDKKRAARAAGAALTWDSEAAKLLAAYRALYECPVR